jgi:hypothetical protein
MPVWTASRNRRVSGPAPCIAISLCGMMRSSKRSTGVRWKSWLRHRVRRSDASDRGPARLLAAVCRLHCGRAHHCAALNSVAGGLSRLYESSRSLVQGAIEELVERAKRGGDVRTDIDASDLLRAVIGVSYVTSGRDWQRSAGRLAELLIAGSRPAE